MPTDNAVPRITELRIKGLRTLEDVTLKLGNVNVLIGENGCGKSSVVEAVRLLQMAALSDTFTSNFFQAHGGFSDLLRRDSVNLRLSAVVETPRLTSPTEYSLELSWTGETLAISDERVVLKAGAVIGDVPLFIRGGRRAQIFDAGDRRTELELDRSDAPLLGRLRGPDALGSMQLTIDLVRSALAAVDVQVPFSTAPRWVSRALAQQPSLRAPAVLEPVDRVPLGGLGLANAYFKLRNERSPREWETTMEYVRLGLGEDVESINTRADAGGGSIGMTLKRRGVDKQESAYVLSDGMLAYLAFVAIFRLETPTSLLAFDEPELHLHPSLLARVVGFAESIGERCPVLITTHSDRLLDYLSDPVGSAILMELDEKRATRLLRPDPEMYAKWMDDYRGLGEIRAHGAERSIFTRHEGTGAPK